MNVQTKFDEQITITTDPAVMKGNFLAERLLRKWEEDFVDEDTNEVVSIERKEIILDRGVLLDNSNLSTIQFHLASGDITEVKISNVQREGLFKPNYNVSIWNTTIDTGKKKRNIYLYANSIDMAVEIAKDYTEQTTPCYFGISGVKQLDFAHLITDTPEDDEGDKIETYKMEVEVSHDESLYNQNFIVCASNAEKAKAAIEEFLTYKFKEKKQSTDFTVTIFSATTIPCETLIDMDFSKKYLEQAEAKEKAN